MVTYPGFGRDCSSGYIINTAVLYINGTGISLINNENPEEGNYITSSSPSLSHTQNATPFYHSDQESLR